MAFEIGASKTSPGGGGRAKQLNNEMRFSVNAAVVLEAIHSRSFLPAEVDWLPVRATMAKLRPGFFIFFFFVFFFLLLKTLQSCGKYGAKFQTGRPKSRPPINKYIKAEVDLTVVVSQLPDFPAANNRISKT